MSRECDFIKDLTKDREIWKIAIREIDSCIGGARNVIEPGHNFNRKRQISLFKISGGECSYNINIIK
jgi:hypothetical protein